VSLRDDVFADTEELARRLQTSRSRLYADALREYLARHAADRVTAALDAVYTSEPSGLDAALATAAAHVIEKTDW
jgi:metal-responsive CopG/Arc/MetJ family transcriptional regulator